MRRHERRRLHRVQPVVPVAAAGLRRAVAALHSEVAVRWQCSEVAVRWRCSEVVVFLGSGNLQWGGGKVAVR